MKIAIVAFYVLDSELPLIRQLPQLGCDVSLYSLLPSGDQNAFVFNFFKNPQPFGFVDNVVLKKSMGKRISNYLSTVKTKVFIYPNRWFQKLFLFDLYSAFKFSKHLKKQNYDFVHMMHTSGRFLIFLFLFLDKRKIIQSLHEVTSHESKTSFLNKLILRLLISYRIPIIFHSNISKQRFVEFTKEFYPKKTANNNVAMIRFGLFETYNLFANPSIEPNKTSSINITNIGRIVPYKGIHILIDAVKLVQDKYPIKLTIAGGGIPYFSFEGIHNYEFINKSLPSEEMVKLIQESDIIVLPYTSGSQSGIPMTAFLFNKPIIASNIESFKEIIENNVTGILYEDFSSQKLAAAIETLISDISLRQSIIENIKIKYRQGEFSWEEIAEKTYSFYKDQKK